MPAILEAEKRAGQVYRGDLAIEVVGKQLRVYEVLVTTEMASKLRRIAYSDTFMKARYLKFDDATKGKSQDAKDFTVARLYHSPEKTQKIIAKYFPKYARSGAQVHMHYSGHGPSGTSGSGKQGFFTVPLSGTLLATEDISEVLCPECGSTEHIRFGPKDDPDTQWRGTAQCGVCDYCGPKKVFEAAAIDEKRIFIPSIYKGPTYKVGDEIVVVRRFGWKRGYKPIAVKPPVPGKIIKRDVNVFYPKGPATLVVLIDPKDYARVAPGTKTQTPNEITVKADEVRLKRKNESIDEGKVTLGTVNKMLKAKGVKEKLVKGKGYYYFIGGGASGWYTASVMTSQVDAMTLDGWWSEYKELKSARESIDEVYKLPRHIVVSKKLFEELRYKIVEVDDPQDALDRAGVKAIGEAKKAGANYRIALNTQAAKRIYLALDDIEEDSSFRSHVYRVYVQLGVAEAVSDEQLKGVMVSHGKKHWFTLKGQKYRLADEPHRALRESIDEESFFKPGQKVKVASLRGNIVSLVAKDTTVDPEYLVDFGPKGKHKIKAYAIRAVDDKRPDATLVKVLKAIGTGAKKLMATLRRKPATAAEAVASVSRIIRAVKGAGFNTTRVKLDEATDSAFTKSLRALAKKYGGKVRLSGGFASVSFADAMKSPSFRAALKKELGVTPASQRSLPAGKGIANIIKLQEAMVGYVLVDPAGIVVKRGSARLMRKWRKKNGKGWRVSMTSKDVGEKVLEPVDEAAAPTRNKAVDRKPKEEVNYRHSQTDKDGDKRCGTCSSVVLPDACQLVRGKIEQDDICDLWKKGIAEGVAGSNDKLVTKLGLVIDDNDNYKGNAILNKEMKGGTGVRIGAGRVFVQYILPDIVALTTLTGNTDRFTKRQVQRYLTPADDSMYGTDSVSAEKVAEGIQEAAAKGKAQAALLAFMEKTAEGGDYKLSAIAKRPEFTGIHFKKLMSAAKALGKKGLIWYDGMSKIGPARA
jgi:hypothetical protein